MTQQTFVALCKGRRILVQAPTSRDAALKVQKQLRAKSIRDIIITVADQPHAGK